MRAAGFALMLALVVGAACDKEKGLKITNIEPKVGPHTGGSSVTIIGNGFQEGGAKGVKVYFGDKPARVLMFKGDSELIVEPPPGQPDQTVDVEILFDDARRHIYKEAYHYTDLTEGFGVDELTGGGEGEGAGAAGGSGE